MANSGPSLANTQSLVFARDNGIPCKFFVEASAVRGRPKLIRLITKNGGLVVNAAREADILLAENNTKEALELFEAWCGDKVVLSTRWVARCLEVNAFLGMDNGWGGYQLTRKGLCEGLEAQDDDLSDFEVEDERPSKKPRTSPATFDMSPNSSNRRSRQSEAGPSRHHFPNISPSNGTRKHPFPPAERTSEQNGSNLSAMSYTPVAWSSSDIPYHLTQNLSVPTDAAMHFPLPQPLQTNLQHHQQQQHHQQHHQHQQQQQQQQQQQALFRSVFGDLVQPQQQPHTEDALSYWRQHPNLSQFSSLPAPASHHFAQQVEVPPHLHNLQPNFGVPLSDHGIQGPWTQPIPKHSDVDAIPEAAAVQSEEGKVELSIPGTKSNGKRAISRTSSDNEIQTAIRSNPPRLRENATEPQSGMFRESQGLPKKFYVMVDTKNRKDLLKIVRRNDGTIVSRMDDADYIILNNRSNQFQKALNILPVHKIALAPSWLEDCARLGKVADMAPHVIDITSGVGQGVARRKSPIKTKRFKPEVKGEIGDPGHLEQSIKLSQSPVRTIVESQENTHEIPRSNSRSPSPPRGFSSVGPGGKFLFTEEDRIWFFKYSRFKLERNPHLSHTALLRMIGQKAPLHSAKSWDNCWRSKWHNEMTTLKREMVALHQAMHVALPSSPPPPTEAEYPGPQSSPSNHALPPSSAPPSYPSSQVDSPQTPSAGSITRIEKPNEIQCDSVSVNRQEKARIGQDAVIDVDSFPEAWLKLP